VKRSNHSDEVASGQRFQFGANWLRFSSGLDETQLRIAATSLADRLGDGFGGGGGTLPIGSPTNVIRFLDIGCGSGIFSLAARNLGASVVSIDYDPDAIACTSALREKHFPGDAQWQVTEVSVLDQSAMQALGEFDVVYAWGSLHHTGQMWNAIKQALLRVSPGGVIVLAIYNDQGFLSHLWRGVKRLYCSSAFGRVAVLSIAVPYFYGRSIVGGLARGRSPAATIARYRTTRGMSRYHDIVDWVGGLPFEVASPETVVQFASANGFEQRTLHPVGRAHGNNEFVFRRSSVT
jgi:2-polyprenyl-3-methyl-5-hydroxy-6-metoxy-1,4-benzoquinol methylase